MARNREDGTDTDTMTAGPVFEAPPTVTRSHDKDGKWEPILAPLRDYPGQWARVTPEPTTKANATVNFLKSGNAKGVDGNFDFVSRTTGETVTGDDGKEQSLGHVYAIYLTDEQRAEKDEYARVTSERRRQIKQAKDALGEGATDEQKQEAVKALDLPELPTRSYMP